MFIFCLSLCSFAQAKSVKIEELENIVNSKCDSIIIVNLWATFCKPCVEEIPSFVKFAKEHEDVQMVFVSLDMKESFPKTVNKFIARLKMKGINLWLDEKDAEIFVPKIDDAWSGALPASLIINKKSGIKIFVDGSMTEQEILAAYKAVK